MRKYLFVALSVFLLAPGAFAQTVYKQKTFIFSEGESIQGDHLVECMEGLEFIARTYNYRDINPNFAFKSKIFSVGTWDKTGKVKEQKEQIGEILICQDWQTYFPEKLVTPVYFEIIIGGRKYRAAGAGTSPNIPQYDILPGGGSIMAPEEYPEFGVNFYSYTATVFPALEGKPGGMFYIGNLGFADGSPREYYNHFGTAILQLTVPQDSSGE